MSDTEKQTRLTWQEGRWQSHEGSAGEVKLFSIHYHTQRGDPAWFLRTELPQLGHMSWKDDSKDALKEMAEKVLDAWLTQIGAFL